MVTKNISNLELGITMLANQFTSDKETNTHFAKCGFKISSGCRELGAIQPTRGGGDHPSDLLLITLYTHVPLDFGNQRNHKTSDSDVSGPSCLKIKLSPLLLIICIVLWSSRVWGCNLSLFLFTRV